MIPQVNRTGKVELNERGFTVWFSVDNQSHTFSVKYYERDKWRTYPDHLKKYVAELVGAVWVAAIPSENKVFTHKLSEADVELLKFITYQTQGLYRYRMQYPSIEDRPKMKVTYGERDWQEMLPLLGDDDCSLFFSGGRDAFTALGILEDAGYDPHLHMHNIDTSWDAGELARSTFDKQGRDFDTIWNNLGVLKREITREHNVFWKLEVPKFFVMFFSAFPYLDQELLLFGSEATTTRFVKVAKDRLLHQSWEQSLFANYYMTQWAENSGLPLRVGSINRGLTNYRTIKILGERYPDYDEIARSCFFVNTNEEDYPPCSRCHKDFRNYLCRKAAYLDTSMYDEEQLSEYKIDPANLEWQTLFPSELSHINANVHYFPDVIPMKSPNVEGVMMMPDKCNPTYFLTREEFIKIYEAVRGEDDYWLPADPDVDWQSETDYWIPTRDPDKAYDILESWDTLDMYDYSTKVTRNNSLLNLEVKE